MNKVIVMEILIASMIMLSGCCSIGSYNASERELSNPAIRAFQIESGAGIGLDLGALDILGQHPWRQTGAALLDAITLYAVYEGIESLNEDNDSNSTSNSTSGDTLDITINGDGDNDIHIGDDNSE